MKILLVRNVERGSGGLLSSNISSVIDAHPVLIHEVLLHFRLEDLSLLGVEMHIAAVRGNALVS